MVRSPERAASALAVPVQVVRTEKGQGLTLGVSVRKGQYLLQYGGQLRPAADCIASPSNYQFFVTKRGKAPQFCVDATVARAGFGLARLVNHSRKSSNARMQAIRHRTDKTKRLALFATRDMAAGTELLYDYGDRDTANQEAFPWLAS